jgi:hypothetical protein
MLKGQLLHPQILSALGASGHGSGILIADGNYPFNTRANPDAERVYLNLAPGLLTVTERLMAQNRRFTRNSERCCPPLVLAHMIVIRFMICVAVRTCHW